MPVHSVAQSPIALCTSKGSFISIITIAPLGADDSGQWSEKTAFALEENLTPASIKGTIKLFKVFKERLIKLLRREEAFTMIDCHARERFALVIFRFLDLT